MLRFFEYILILFMLASTLTSFPIQNGITVDSMWMWENACLVAGGRQRCHQIAGDAIRTLSTAAGPCDQQDIADSMISFAKRLHNDFDMIKFAQIFAQEPRHNPTSQSMLYCQFAPANAELNGLFQCQLAGISTAMFVGDIAVGEYGTIPFGHTSPLSPPGSCPAHPSGPIPAGTQLAPFFAQDSEPSNVGSSGSSSRNLHPRALDLRNSKNSGRETVSFVTVTSTVTIAVAPTAIDVVVASPIPAAFTPNAASIFTPELIDDIFDHLFVIVTVVTTSLLGLLTTIVHARWGKNQPNNASALTAS